MGGQAWAEPATPHPPPPHPEVNMRDRGRTKRILKAATDNWFSRGYLALCAGLLVWVAADSFLAMAAGPSAPLLFLGLLTLAAYFNATLLGLLVRSLRQRSSQA